MHRPLSRANTVGTVTLSTLGALSALFACSLFWLYHMNPPRPHVAVAVDVLKFNQMWHHATGQNQPFDSVFLQVNISANLREYWNWNVKQLFVFLTAKYMTKNFKENEVVVWDFIAVSEEKSAFNITRPAKYTLEHKGEGLRGQSLHFTLRWSVMPYSGLSIYGTSHEAAAVATVQLPTSFK